MRAMHLVVVGGALALSGCGKAPEAGTGGGAAQGGPAPAAWLLASAPSEARPVAEVKADATEGQVVVIRGRIGGRAEPIRADSAVFVIMDPAIPSCADMGEDHCPQPWDYCCEPSESLVANSATVQLVDSTGAALATDPIAAGLKPLDEVIVVGTVGPRPNGDVLTIKATGVHRVGG